MLHFLRQFIVVAVLLAQVPYCITVDKAPAGSAFESLENLIKAAESLELKDLQNKFVRTSYIERCDPSKRKELTFYLNERRALLGGGSPAGSASPISHEEAAAQDRADQCNIMLSTSLLDFEKAISSPLRTPATISSSLRSCLQYLKNGKWQKLVATMYEATGHDQELFPNFKDLPDNFENVSPIEREKLKPVLHKFLPHFQELYTSRVKLKSMSSPHRTTPKTRLRKSLEAKARFNDGIKIMSKKELDSYERMQSLHDHVSSSLSPASHILRDAIELTHNIEVDAIPSIVFPSRHVCKGNAAGGKHVFESEQEFKERMLDVSRSYTYPVFRNLHNGVLSGLVQYSASSISSGSPTPAEVKSSTVFPDFQSPDVFVQWVHDNFRPNNVYARGERREGAQAVLFYQIPGAPYLIESLSTESTAGASSASSPLPIVLDTLYPVFSYTAICEEGLRSAHDDAAIHLFTYSDDTSSMPAANDVGISCGELRNLIAHYSHHDEFQAHCTRAETSANGPVVLMNVRPYLVETKPECSRLTANVYVEVPASVFGIM